MIQILRKPGWILNPNDKIVNAILKRAEACDGECPCDNPYKGTDDAKCPCKGYREEDHCCCKLYIKEDDASTNRQ